MLWKCYTQYASKFGQLSSGQPEKVSFHSHPKDGQCQRMFKLPHNCTSHASKVMLKSLQARLQQDVNWELSHVQAGFRKDRGIRDQVANLHWIIEKAREFQKENIYFCFIDYNGHHNKLWKTVKEMGIPEHLTFLLRNLYAGQEATVRTICATTDWFKLLKGICLCCILSPCLFNLHTQYSMQTAGMDETQAGNSHAGWMHREKIVYLH